MADDDDADRRSAPREHGVHRETELTLSLASVPNAGASWDEICQFAQNFDGYAYWGSFEACAAIANERRHATVHELQTCLYWESRRARHFGEEPDQEELAYIREVIAKLRAKLGDTAG